MKFKPTYLYIKQHRITGMKYFGKTTKNVLKYSGSGLYWKRHLKKYGNDVETVWYQLFNDYESLISYAIEFSESNDIISSNEWANLINENGLDGAPVGHKPHIFTDEDREKMSKTVLERWSDEGYKKRLSESHKDRWIENPELKERQSKRMKDEFWTDDRKSEHSRLMKDEFWNEERKETQSKFMKDLIRTDEHCSSISKALKGKPKSQSHKDNLKIPKVRVCRISDRKEMSVNHFNRSS